MQDRKMLPLSWEPHCRNRVGKITFYSLLDKQGKWAGSLRPHHNIPGGEAVHDAGDVICELVSISKGSVSNSEYIHSRWIDEWYLPERPKLSERYNFHNILWIFWEHGIAYRRGLGRVVEEVWQEQDGDEIMLVLG